MIKGDIFVTFEFAKQLKEKGYPNDKYNGLLCYNHNGEQFIWNWSVDNIDEDAVSCPSIPKVESWLKDIKHIDITWTWDYNSGLTYYEQLYKHLNEFLNLL